MTSFRTDRNNNPTAVTTDVAKLGLEENIEFVQGESFVSDGHEYYTAKLIGDPIKLTLELINKIGFYTFTGGHPRWNYIAIPNFVWAGLLDVEKIQVIQFMYHREGGTELEHLFA